MTIRLDRQVDREIARHRSLSNRQHSDFDPNTYSNRLIDLIVPYVTGRNGIDRGEAEAWAQALRLAGEQGEYFFSLNRYLFVAQTDP